MGEVGGEVLLESDVLELLGTLPLGFGHLHPLYSVLLDHLRAIISKR